MTHDAARITSPARHRALLALLLVGLLALAGLLAPATAAHAAEIPGAITHVTLDKTEYGYNAQQKVTFTWAVPNSAAVGDTFAFVVPKELSAVSQAPFALKDSSGATVANAVWKKQTDGSWNIVFTLTNYVDSHDDVGGTAFVATQWNHSVVTQTGGPVTLDFDGIAVQVTIDPKPATPPPCTQNCPPPPPPATSRSLAKSGGWVDGAYEGTNETSDNISWTVALPGNPTGYAGPIDVTDTPAAGSIIDCATVQVWTQSSLASGTKRVALGASRLSLVCAPGSFDLTLDTINPSEFITVTYKGTITDQDSGRYANHVAFTAPGVTTTKDVTMARTSQGGDGGGVQSVSVGDDVWYDTNHDGIQDPGEKGIAGVTLDLTGPDGKPVASVTGATVAPTITDATGHYLFSGLPVLPAGQHYTVTVDGTASAAALAGFVPTLPGVGNDRATDSSTGSATSGDLTVNGASDLTLDFGFVGEVSVGDLVWYDDNHDGIQDPGEKGIAGVTLDLTGPDGKPVVDVNGDQVAPAVTDATGHYLFAHLPTLPAGQHYTVAVDPVASATPLAGYVPTLEHAGDDPSVDSSTSTAESHDLVATGASDLTLDFGYVLPDLPTHALPVPGDPTPAAQLAHTGLDDVAPAAIGGAGLLLLGLVGFAAGRRRGPAARHRS